MPKRTFTSWLNKLSTYVSRGGYLIFTTHGFLSKQKHFKSSKLDQNGFYFQPTSEQEDLDNEEYGVTVVKPKYVFDCLFDIPGLRLKYFHEGYWWGHQDLYIAQLPEL